MLTVIILIPCYNEEKNLKKVLKNINNYLSLNTTLKDKYTIDYLIINDCSTDSTIKICEENGYNYLNLSINLGIGGCMQAGYLYALERGYDIAIQHDGDGQHDPNYLEKMINLIDSGLADIVIGSRFLENKGFQSSGLRRIGIVFLSFLIYICSGIKIYDVTSGYRAINRKYIKIFSKKYAQDYAEPESIMEVALNKDKIFEIPVIMHERKVGESSINGLKSFYYMIKVSLAIILHRLIVSKEK